MVSSPILGVYCGTSIPPSHISSSNKILIHFQTDDIVTKSGGFRMEYNPYDPTIPTTCQGWFGWIGDGYCDDINNNLACRYDGGDCEVVDCDVEPYASLEFCTDYNLNFPNCTVENAARIGNGVWDIAGDYNTEECGYDGGDCSGVEGCTIDESLYELETSLGNGACDKIFNRTECNFDDADCL